MKLSLALCSTLCASVALAASSPHKLNVFNKGALGKRHANVPVVEKRMANQPFKHPELQKRATRFLTDKTKGKISFFSTQFLGEAMLTKK